MFLGGKISMWVCTIDGKPTGIVDHYVDIRNIAHADDECHVDKYSEKKIEMASYLTADK